MKTMIGGFNFETSSFLFSKHARDYKYYMNRMVDEWLEAHFTELTKGTGILQMTEALIGLNKLNDQFGGYNSLQMMEALVGSLFLPLMINVQLGL